MKTKSQVTLFVIIGLVFFIAVIVAVFLLNSMKKQPDPTPVFVENYDADLAPVVGDIKFCLSKLAKEKIIELGLTGGFEVQNNVYLTKLYPEYSNNALEVFEDSGLIIPYWYSIDSSPNCVDCIYKINLPQLEGNSPDSIQSIIERYVDNNIDTCVEGLSKYESKYMISKGKPSTNVRFNKEDTSVELSWPINFTEYDEDTTLYFNGASQNIDVPLKNIYRLASDVLMDIVITQRALEDFTITVTDFLSIGEDSLLPPRAKTEFGLSSPRIFKKSKSKEGLKTQVSENLPFVQIIGSKDHYTIFSADDEILRNIYYRFMYSLNTDDSETLSKTRIRFSYDDTWPLFFDVKPSYGDIIIPDFQGISLPFFNIGMTTYDFSFDVTYPVLVTLENSEAFGGEGYVFQYAFENNIRNSKYYTDEFITIENEFQNQVDYFGGTQELLPVIINVYEKETLAPIEDISISYNCLDYFVPVGTSKIVNGKSEINSFLPPCLNGEFTGLGDNYVVERKTASIMKGQNNKFDLFVTKDKEMTITVKKKLYTVLPVLEDTVPTYKWVFSPSSSVSKEDDEKVVVMLINLHNNEPTGFVQVLEFDDESSKTAIIREGEYRLLVMSELDLDYVFETQSEEVCSPKFAGLFGGECTTVEPIKFNETVLYGYALFDNTTSGNIQITYADLKKNNMNIYYAGFRLNDVQYSRQLDVYTYLFNSTNEYRQELLPTFE